jgi:hypothetical protein
VPQERGDEFTPGIFVGQPFTAIGRIGDMAVLGFGEGVSWDAPSGTGTLTGSRYALHVMCPFRVTQGAERIVVGSEDLRRADGAPFDRGARALEGHLTRTGPVVDGVQVSPRVTCGSTSSTGSPWRSSRRLRRGPRHGAFWNASGRTSRSRRSELLSL